MRVVKTKQNAAAKRELQQSLAEQTALVEQLQQQIQQLKSQQAGVLLQVSTMVAVRLALDCRSDCV